MADPGEIGFYLAPFSSRGPTQDGRLKPDIAAPGVNINAPRAGTANGYVSYSGTSMATPFDAHVPPSGDCSAPARIGSVGQRETAACRDTPNGL